MRWITALALLCLPLTVAAELAEGDLRLHWSASTQCTDGSDLSVSSYRIYSTEEQREVTLADPLIRTVSGETTEVVLEDQLSDETPLRCYAMTAVGSCDGADDAESDPSNTVCVEREPIEAVPEAPTLLDVLVTIDEQEEEADVTQHFTDFGDQTADQEPTGWTKRYDTGAPWTIRAEAAATGGKYLEIGSMASSSRSLLSWDEIDGDAGRDDVEIVVRHREPTSIDGADSFGFFRGTEPNGNVQGYRIGNSTSPFRLRVNKYVDGSFSAIEDDTSIEYDADEWVFFRGRVNGADLKAKMWRGSVDDEPVAWDIETTDADIAGVGWAGLFRFNENEAHIDWIGVGTAGDTAPTESTEEGPEITAIDPDPAVVGQNLTLTGQNFGD